METGRDTSAAAWSPPRSFYARVGKRALDIAITLLLLLPATILILALLFATSGSTPFYRHTRIGRGGKPFHCLKLRTMAVDAEDRLAQLLDSDPEAAREWRETRKLQNDPRITPTGHVLRKTGLDELPQFWNVLRGDMSLVGPRPVVAEELEHYQHAREAYLSVRPGLTGAWQIAPGRNEMSYAQRVALDRDYAASVTLGHDLRLLLGTLFWAMNPNGR